MEVVSEAHVLAEKSGLESSVVEGLLERNYGDYAHGISTRLTTGAYAPAPGAFTSPFSPISTDLEQLIYFPPIDRRKSVLGFEFSY